MFKDVFLKETIAMMGKQLRINVVDDDLVKDNKLNIELNEVTIKAAMKIVMIWQHLQARLIEDKTILVFPDNETMRRRYEQHKSYPRRDREIEPRIYRVRLGQKSADRRWLWSAPVQ